MAKKAKFINIRVLPEDIILEILLRLPVKSLSRFRSVSKQWNVTITSKSFIHKHFQHETNRTRLLAYSYDYMLVNYTSDPAPEDNYSFALFPVDTLERYEEPDHLKLPGPLYCLLGPCNGVFCVINKFQKLALWNPATRKFRPLPSPPETLYEAVEMGFGVDPTTNEFKVVLIQGHVGELYHDLPEDLVCSWLCHRYSIYTSSNDTWRCFENEMVLDPGAYVSAARCGTTFLNGFCYWRKFSPGTCTSIILSFDMHNEVFEEIELPEVVRSRLGGDLDLFNDSLALFSYGGEVPDSRSIDIWLMNEHGHNWTKLYTVVLPFRFQWPLGFWKTSKIFLLIEPQEHVQVLVTYDIHSHTSAILRVEYRSEDADSYNGMWLFNYKEGLGSVKSGHGVEDYDIESEITSEFFYPDEADF